MCEKVERVIEKDRESFMPERFDLVTRIGVAYSPPAKVFGWKKETEMWNEIEHRV